MVLPYLPIDIVAMIAEESAWHYNRCGKWSFIEKWYWNVMDAWGHDSY